MLKYRPFEMHCHTRHSDGTFLVPQLIESVHVERKIIQFPLIIGNR